MKRLANLKNNHTDQSNTKQLNGKRSADHVQNHSYQPMNDQPVQTSTSALASRQSSSSNQQHSISLSQDGGDAPKSRAPTLGTTNETVISGAGTSATIARTEGDRDSTFSSPAPSLRSMTTTLTTMQSTTPVIAGTGNTAYNTQQPASAIPAHLVPHPATYHLATANGVLTDDASILTLASSSKRRRRNSLDTNASIRALAPQSVFGGSRESLPLSVLSGSAHHFNNTRDTDTASLRDNSSTHYPRSISAMNVERASLISASGVTAPALTSERNSYISSRPTGDAASVRSGMLGHNDRERERSLYHARNDSIGGLSIARDRIRDTPRESNGPDYFKEMVTAPTSPMPG